MSTHQDINDAINRLKEEISFKEELVKTLQELDIEKTVDEEKWHILCESPLRNSTVLCQILKNIFPKATNIKLQPNYIKFELYDFGCRIPITRCRGIEVDTYWWRRIRLPEKIYNNITHIMYKYFLAKDEKANWKILFDLRLNSLDYYPTFIKFLMWFGKYKWKDDHRTEWENEFKRQYDEYLKNVEEAQKNILEMNTKAKNFFYVLIPELSKFSKKISAWDEPFGSERIKMIMEKENINEDLIKEKIKNVELN